MRPTVDALSKHFRVVTFSLRGDAGLVDDYVQQVVDALDERGIRDAVICGVSFGGLVALRVAAAHPTRTRALVLASTPGPGFALKPRHQLYARLPWIFGPLFLLESPWRLRKEIAAALPGVRDRWAFRIASLKTVLTAPLSLSQMAARTRLMTEFDSTNDCTRVSSPTLVVTGESALDYVVPVDGSSQYTGLIRGARAVTLARTGHIGTMTRPDAFAETIRTFVDGLQHVAA